MAAKYREVCSLWNFIRCVVDLSCDISNTNQSEIERICIRAKEVIVEDVSLSKYNTYADDRFLSFFFPQT